MNNDDFPEIKTGNCIDRDLAATTNDRIKKAVIEIYNLKESITKLEKTIIALDSKNEKLQKRIFWLTIVGLVFTATQIVQVVDIVARWLK